MSDETFGPLDGYLTIRTKLLELPLAHRSVKRFAVVDEHRGVTCEHVVGVRCSGRTGDHGGP